MRALKTIISTVLILALMSVFSGCGENETSSTSVPSQAVPSQAISSQSVSASADQPAMKILNKILGNYTVFSYLDECALLYSVSDKSVLTLYLYDFNTDSVETLESIENFVFCSNESAYINGVLYWNTLIHQDGKNRNVLCSLDVSAKKVTLSQHEELAQNVFNTFKAGNSVCSLKSRTDKDIGTTYIDVYDTKSKTSREVLQAKGNTSDGSGRFIDAACGFEDNLYLLVCDGKKYFVERYDSSLSLIYKLSAEAVMKHLRNEYVSSFKMLNEDTFYISCYSGDNLICRLNEKDIEILYSADYTSPLYFASTHNSSHSVFFAEKDIYIYDGEKQKVYKSTVSGTSPISSVHIYQKNILVITKSSSGEKAAKLLTTDTVLNDSATLATDLSQIGR